MAFDRLKKKDLSYFQLEDGDLSAEALGLGFLENMQATSLSEEDQYGFRHLTVQEYLAALYTCKVLLKKAEDVVRFAGELGCGEEAGHLNTFWVFVAGLIDESLREELFCSIAETNMETVSRSMRENEHAAKLSRAVEPLSGTGGEREGTGGEPQNEPNPRNKPLDHYRFLFLLNCFAEGTTGSIGKPSNCVGWVLNRQGAIGRFHGGLSHSDLRTMSRVMEYHSDAVEKMDVQGCGMGDSGLQQLLPGLLSCARLKVLDLSWNNLSKSHMEV